MLRYAATKLIMKHITDQPVVSNLGPTSDELWHASKRDRNLYTYGSMGLCSSIALGMAVSIEQKVIALEGDGSTLMNLGSLGTVGRVMPANLIILVWDNEKWAQTGYQASHTAYGTDLESVARATGFKKTSTVSNEEDLDLIFAQALAEPGPWYIVAKIQEQEYLPVAPVEPEATLHRFRSTFVDERKRIG